MVFVSNLVLPFIMFHKHGAAIKAIHNPKFDLAYFLDQDNEAFIEFCCKQFATESILFYQDVKIYQTNSSENKAREIFTSYVKSGSNFEVNLEYQIIKNISMSIQNRQFDATLFDVALKAIIKMLNEDVITLWINERSTQTKNTGSNEFKSTGKTHSSLDDVGSIGHDMV